MVVDDEDSPFVTLEEYWIRSVQKREVDEVEDEELNGGIDKDTLAKAGKICSMACDVLIQIAEILSVRFFLLAFYSSLLWHLSESKHVVFLDGFIRVFTSDESRSLSAGQNFLE